MKQSGTFVISLDFELMWGMFDKVTLDTYSENFKATHHVVPQLLELFARYDIHATWATVGMLMCHDAADWKKLCDATSPHPKYLRSELSAYRHGVEADLSTTAGHHFAPDLVKRILATPHQELASHTFSHYYTLEEQVGGEVVRTDSFAADCTTMRTLANRFHTHFTSLVFPRNQWSKETLDTAAKHGITCYRGTEHNFLYNSRTDQKQNNLFIRALRLLDHYCNFSGHHTHRIDRTTSPVNVPSSRFLRPYSKQLWLLEPLRLRRIKRAMTHAAKHGECYHLWWHPHNFGAHTEKNLVTLETILLHYQKLQKRYDLQSCTMHEVATQTDEYIA